MRRTSRHLGWTCTRISTQIKFQAPRHPSMQRERRPGGYKNRVVMIPSPKSLHATSSSLEEVQRANSGRRGGRLVSADGAEGSSEHEPVGQALPRRRNVPPPRGQKASGWGWGDIITGADDFPASAPRREVVVLTRSRNICREFALGKSCLTEGCPQGLGHISPGHYAAADRAWLDGEPGLRGEGGQAIGFWGRP